MRGIEPRPSGRAPGHVAHPRRHAPERHPAGVQGAGGAEQRPGVHVVKVGHVLPREPRRSRARRAGHVIVEKLRQLDVKLPRRHVELAEDGVEPEPRGNARGARFNYTVFQ